MPGANLSAYAHIGDDLRNSLFVLIEHGEVIETIETRKDNIDAFGTRLVEYIRILGMNPARVYVKQWGAGLILHKAMERLHGLRLGSIMGNEVMKRVDMQIMDASNA